MKKKFLLLFFCLMSSVFCVGEAGAIFLLINPGSSAAGTGEAQVAKANDAYASYYNPAGLGFQYNDEVVLQHVNWLPNLADDIFYDFVGYKKHIPSLGGTFAGHLIYLNLGEQTGTDEWGNYTYNFSSYMMALTGGFGMPLSSSSSIGMNFKVFHQKLAEIATVGESGKPYSTDFAFDVGYLKKFDGRIPTNFGLAIQNIGPPIDFLDQEQSDPAPTNMRIGIYSKLYEDDINKVHLLIDANKLLVASYPDMDWNGDGIISGSKEFAHTDPWHKAIFSAWLDDWYYGGDYDLCEQGCSSDTNNNFNYLGYGADKDERIGGYYARSFNRLNNSNDPENIVAYVPNYENFCLTDEVYCYSENGDLIRQGINEGLTPKYLDLPHDGQNEWTWDSNQNQWISGTNSDALVNDVNGDGVINDSDELSQEYYDIELSDDYEYSFSSSEYGIFNPYGEKEKGTGDDRGFEQELKEMIYNVGLEWWYTDNFAMRLGFIYDEEGDVKNPTFGAGIKFNNYGFDFGYTSGPSGHPRSNTMFFSLSLGL